MSPRPRKATDEQIFAAAQRVMMRLTPERVTLAEIAAEAGLTAGALVQRYGSKRALLVKLSAEMQAFVPQLFAGLRATHDSPLAIVRAYGACLAGMASSPALLAHHLSWLSLDFTDPDMQRGLRAQARATLAELERLLAEAVTAGELPPATNRPALARALQVAMSGSLMIWAHTQDESSAARMRADVDAQLAAFSAAARAPTPPRRRKRQG